MIRSRTKKRRFACRLFSGLSQRCPSTRLAKRFAELAGVEPAFLLIDSLDAVRGGAGEFVFKSLIEQVLSLAGGRWRVIASIRSFDLRLGTQFRRGITHQ